MAQSDIKIAIDTHFNTSWTDTPIQFQGQELDTTNLDQFISIQYSPIDNGLYGLNGTANGRMRFSGLFKVFAYAKNYNKALILADAIKSFLNGLELNDMYVEIGQDGSPHDTGVGFIEVLTTFEVNQWGATNHSEDYLIQNYGITDAEGNFLTDETGAYLLQDY